MDALMPRIWHKGPPPHPGWWNASLQRSALSWRWWNGREWSFAVKPAEMAGPALNDLAAAAAPSWDQEDMEWNDYWPADARVPRLNPGHSSCMWKGKMWAWIDGELVCEWPPKQMVKPAPQPDEMVSVKREDLEGLHLQFNHLRGVMTVLGDRVAEMSRGAA